MSVANLIYRFLRLGPVGLSIVAILVLVGGYFLQVEMDKSAAADARALAAGPPKAVDIANFDRDRDMSPVREVVVEAQPVLDYAYRLTIEKRGADDHVFMVPLVAAGSSSETDIVGIAYFTSPNEDFDNITPELLLRGMSEFGDVGPVIAYNGRLRSMGAWDDLTEEAFFDQGLVMPSNVVVVWPYMEGREVALAPPQHGDLTVFGLLSAVAGAIGLLALVKFVLRKKSKTKDVAPPTYSQGYGAPATRTVDNPVAQPAQAASTMPLWKQRSGWTEVEIVDGEESEVKPAETVPLQRAEPLQNTARPMIATPSIQAPKRKFGVRAILISFVGALFALGLFYTVFSLLGEVKSTEVVSISTPQERVADAVADAIIPDAPTDRHWTEIDVTPVFEWLTAKALLALTGDTDAMITMGMVLVGVFALLYLPWWFFVMRSSLKSRRTGRFDSLGL